MSEEKSPFITTEFIENYLETRKKHIEVNHPLEGKGNALEICIEGAKRLKEITKKRKEGQ